MLTIRYINPSGLFSWGRTGNIDVERRGLVNLLGVNADKDGDSNGSGKSSLFNAMCEILYGENPTGVSGNEVVNQVMDAGFAGRVEFVGPTDGRYYRVTYCRSWKEDFYPVDTNTGVAYRGTALYFDMFDGETWIDQRGATMSETRKLIVGVLGITYSRFVSIAYLSYRTGSRFLRGTNKERVDILAGITGVEEWDALLGRARNRRTELQRTIQGVQEQISYQQGQLQAQQDYFERLDATDWEALAQERGAELNALDPVDVVDDLITTQQAHIASLTEQQQQAYETGGVGALSQEVSDLVMQEAALRNPQNVEASLPEFDPTLETDVMDTRTALDSARGQVQMFLRDGDIREMEKCPTCGTKITAARKKSVQSTLDQLEAECVQHEEAWGTAVKARNAAQEEIQAARAAKYQECQKEADHIKGLIAEKRAEMERSNIEYERLGQEIRTENQKLYELQLRRQSIVSEQQRLEKEIAEAEQMKRQLEEVNDKINEIEGAILGLQNQITDSVADVEILDWLVSNIPYIKLHRLSVTMTKLSEQVNKYLADMGDTTRVNISSFEEKKSAKGAGDVKDLLKSEVKVEVVDGTKNIDPRLYSDGETARISNALIRALHDMALQCGHGCNLMLLDEIFAFVDTNNSQRLVDSFTSVGSGTTMITDNSGHVNNLLEFDETWVARKENGLTTLGVQ